MRADILTLFPEMFPGYLEASILGRAQAKKLLDAKAHQLRDWTHDPRKTVDDKPYGGGPGMVMQVQPFHEALKALKVIRTAYRVPRKRGTKNAARGTRVILTSAKGKLFTQADALRLSKYDRLVFLCGRYEGVDERVAKKLADEELSIGPYVMTGGELAALVMLDAVTRLRPGVLGKEASLEQESWSDGQTREYPQYTRPENYLGWKVPKELLSGDHAKIAEWRKKQSKG
ncbi:tRNA (guanosine(37)-N1)-methyltransferase TrmD [Candidatus Uhrbacteria bacterium]|nr:tRNA (guanosine(37)-N1)-methyltransferase TrmD [Candidatus Uhrbacteria bacterium]